MRQMNVCVVGGAGYVGLITGLGLSEIGHQLINVDVDESRILQLQAGESPIYEAGIREILKRNLEAKRIRFSTDLAAAVVASQVVFIAVGTPAQDDGQADMSQVIAVLEELERCIDSYKLVVIKSTAPVGTVDLALGILSRKMRVGEDFDIVVNPEFLREGKGFQDFFYPDRIVVGASSKNAFSIMRDLYQPVVEGDCGWSDGEPHPSDYFPIPIVETDPTSAQMIKYASNAYLAARISFINEIAGLCDRVGADVRQVSWGMGFDPRIGHKYLNAGLGFGGPCLEKDLLALVTIAQGNSYETHLLRAVLERNQQQVEQVIAKLRQLAGQLLYGKTVAVFGLAFKAGTNDVRNSLPLRIIDRLEKEGVAVRAYDPEARANLMHGVQCDDPYQTASGADALLILTEWATFKELDYRHVKSLMSRPLIVDARNLLDGEELRRTGFTYLGMGTP